MHVEPPSGAEAGTPPAGANPTLTVVVTTKDRPHLVRRALASARQVPVPVQLVVVDDGSQEPYQADASDVAVVRHDSSRGANAARNSGLAAATARWVVFLDDDDELVGEGIGRAVRDLEGWDSDEIAVLGTLVSVDEGTGRQESHVPLPLPRGADWLAGPRFQGRHAHNGLVVSARQLRSVGGFDEQIRAWTHDELFLRLLLAVELRTIPDAVYLMYENPARSTLRQQQLNRVDGILRTLERHDALHGPNRVVTANLMSAAGMHYARARRWADARRAFTQAVRADPSRRVIWVRLARSLSGQSAS